jgi:photosystem II stability/assembly factor-like uncharacterized protein
MRQIIISLAVVIILHASSSAQDTGWVAQTTGTTQWLHGVDFVNSSTGWAVGELGTILKSTTSGLSWVSQTSGTELPIQAVDFINPSVGYVVGGCVGCTDGIILKTTDGGATWAVKDSGRSLSGVQFISAAVGFAVGDNGLILKTTDGGGTWADQSPGVISSLISVFFIDSTTGWVGGFTPGVLFKTTNTGASWAPETTGLDPNQDIAGVFFADHQIGWLAGFGFPGGIGTGIIKKTTNGGVSWVDETSGTDQYLLSLAFINATTGWAVGTGGTVVRTTNGGASWAPDVSGTQVEFDHIEARAGDGVWIAGDNGSIVRKNFGALPWKLTLSENNNWNMVCLPMTVSDDRKTSLFPTAQSPAFLYNGSGYQLANNLVPGKGYWLRFSGNQDVGIIGYPVDSVTITLAPNWNLVGGIAVDVPVSNLIQNPPGSILAVYGYTSSYFSATTIEHGKAYWMRSKGDCQVTIRATLDRNIPKQLLTDLSTLRTDEVPPPAPGQAEAANDKRLNIPGEFALSQNYPNPFNPSTLIKYDLPEQSVVRLSVFNVLGQEVAVLVNGVVEAGYQSIEWNTTSNTLAPLPSGVYVYRIMATSLTSAKEFREVKKLVFLK